VYKSHGRPLALPKVVKQHEQESDAMRSDPGQRAQIKFDWGVGVIVE